MVEQVTHNHLVGGPNPSGPSYKGGAWLSWLERHIHIVEVVGSNPIAPILVTLVIIVGIGSSAKLTK